MLAGEQLTAQLIAVRQMAAQSTLTADTLHWNQTCTQETSNLSGDHVVVDRALNEFHRNRTDRLELFEPHNYLPHSIAYSMEQIISLIPVRFASVRLSVYPSVRILTVAFLYRFSPKLAKTWKPLKVQTSSLVSTSHHPFRYFASKTPILGQEVRKICLKCMRIAEIFASFRNWGGETRL